MSKTETGIFRLGLRRLAAVEFKGPLSAASDSTQTPFRTGEVDQQPSSNRREPRSSNDYNPATITLEEMEQIAF